MKVFKKLYASERIFSVYMYIYIYKKHSSPPLIIAGQYTHTFYLNNSFKSLW